MGAVAEAPITDLRPGLGHVECLPLGEARILHNRASGALVASNAFGAALIHHLARTGAVAAAIRDAAAALDIPEAALARPAAETIDRWQADGMFLDAMRPYPGAIAHRPAVAARDLALGLDDRAVILRSECADLADDIARAVAPMGLARPAATKARRAVVLDVVLDDKGLGVFRDGAPVWGVSGYELARFHCLREIMDALCGPRQVAAHLHASAVEKAGVGLVFAGASGSGKSTLATLLLGAGARLAADDHVAIGIDGVSLRAFPTRANLKPGTAALPEIRAVGAGGDGAAPQDRPIARVPVGTPVRLAGFVFPQYGGPDADNALTPIAKAEALGLLIQTGSRVSRSTRSAAPLVHALATRPAWRLSYGDSGFAVSACLDILAAGSGAPGPETLSNGTLT